MKGLNSFYLLFLFFLFFLLTCNRKEENPQSSQSSPLPKIAFEDVTDEAGILFKHVHGGTGEKYFPETMGSGVAFLDYDGDGDLDLFLLNSGSMPGLNIEDFGLKIEDLKDRLFRNNGDGTFTDVTPESKGLGDSGYGMGVAVGDYDNDGDPDLYATNFGPNIFYRNNGDGTFSDATEKAGVGDTLWGTSTLFLDYDADGFLDLFVANYLDFTFQNHKFCGDRIKNIRAYCHPNQYNGVSNVLYHNNGDGTFTDVTRKAGIFNSEGKGLGAVATDYDNDGDLDLYIANDSVRNFLYRNNGDGTFTDVTFETGTGYDEDGKAEAGMGTDAGDVNGDGYFDLFVTNLDHETNTFYENQGGKYFKDATDLAGLGEPSLNYVGWGTNFFDFDSDGDLDLFVANGNVIDNVEILYESPYHTFMQKSHLYVNRGDGNFRLAGSEMGEYFTEKRVGRGTAFGDYDNDGDQDLFVTHNNQEAILLRNDGGNRNNWILIKTIGTKSNRDGIGARIIVTSGDLVQMEEVRSGTSYLSQNDLRVHFGFENRKKVDLLEIRWPSGRAESYQNLEVNQILTLTEGEGIEKYLP